jgi:hypothetical protein
MKRIDFGVGAGTKESAGNVAGLDQRSERAKFQLTVIDSCQIHIQCKAIVGTRNFIIT